MKDAPQMEEKSHSEWETLAKRHGPAWLETHRAKVDALILTYSDADAEELLNELRERFWGRDLP